MTVAFDTSVLTLVFHPEASPPLDSKTKAPLEHCVERIESLITKLSQAGDSVIIPAPCLAELLTAIPDAAKAIDDISRSTAFEVAPFDSRCAIEYALISQEAVKAGDKKEGEDADWSIVKFDRQIAVIAKTYGASVLYTDDSTQAKFAKKLGLKVIRTEDIKLEQKQNLLNFDDPKTD